MNTVKVFDYNQELDAFIIRAEFQQIAEELGIVEWHAAVWIGRLFRLDNDVGEHWFDNWEAREARAAAAQEVGINPDTLMIIDPDRFVDGSDGPCHTPELRALFWRDVLDSLRLGIDVLAGEARAANALRQAPQSHDAPIGDLEGRIAFWRDALAG